ncbi:MAG: hypothetical protein M0042_00360 [Nitrospiraceae bacterium]|nr:hypothetical protein [Nitrospiraceae bacterium]
MLFAQQALGTVDLKEILRNVVKSMNVFLDYREKYYGVSAKDEKTAIETAQYQSNDALIKSKLVEYQRWWSANKGASINLP